MSKPSANSVIRLRGVRHNNLKNFDLDLPLNRLIVVTGLSGSGKSSLAFDTLFAEGQRRYIETFSPYARQFFDRMDKPKVDSIEGIPPAIAIEQRNSVRSTRSTVGTMTEICDYMKLLWPHIAQLHCRQCGQPVRKDSPQNIWQTMLNAERGMRNAELLITFDLSLTEKISLEESLGLIAKQGYQRLLLRSPAAAQTGTPPPHPSPPLTAGERVPEGRERRRSDSGTRIASFGSFEGQTEEAPVYGTGSDQGLALNEDIVPWGNQKAASSQFEIVRIDDAIARLKLLKSSSLTVVQDRIKLATANRARFVEACEQAYHFGKGKLTIHLLETDRASTLQRFNVSTFLFSNRLHCADCDIEYRGPSPALFSFNHPLGACPACRGFGRIIGIDYNLAIPDRAKTLAEGVVKPWLTGHGLESQRDLMKFCKVRKVPTDVPFEKLPRKLQDWVNYGDPDYRKDEDHEWPRAWYGVKGYFRWLESKAYKMHVRVLLSRYRSYTQCPDCAGKRFQPEALLYKTWNAERGTRNEGDATAAAEHSELRSPHSALRAPRSALTLADFYQLPIRDALQLIDRIAAKHQPKPSDPMGLVLNEVRSRLGYLVEVGLGYITLDRPTRTLSGGETERVNLTTCLGTRLVNTLYVLDEPSVGLHPRDTGRLIKILEQLRDLGNTVVVVEHEASVIRAADQIVDLGPGHGESGGQLVFQGSHREILKSKESLTGQYLSGRKRVEVLAPRPITVAADVRRLISKSEIRNPKSKSEPSLLTSAVTHGWLAIQNASLHNLKNLDVEIPLGRFVCVTGVSGSGKTTLIREVLLPALQSKLKSRVIDQKASDRMKSEDGNEKDDEGESPSTINSPSRARDDHTSTTITGWEHIGHVVLVDQSALGKTPRSNPAVYVGAFDEIREFFAQTDAARQRGLNASAFSFNSVQGQCERCRGAGFEKIEMQFLSDVFIRCPDCEGRRYRPHILEVKIRSNRREEAPFSNLKRNARARAQASRSAFRVPRSALEWSIADLLDATVDEVIVFLSSFSDSRPVQRAVEKLKLLQEVGVGYLRLGQPINTLSGGESQRLKLVSHLAESAAANPPLSPPGRGTEGRHGISSSPLRGETADEHGMTGSPPLEGSGVGLRPPTEEQPASKSTLFLFDEPTTGLHFDDVRVLLKVFQRLVDAGHSVIVVEHNLDVIKCADWVIDLGPEAGDQGGQLVAQGTPEDIAARDASHTGRFLRQVLGPATAAGGKVRKWEIEHDTRLSHPPAFPPASPKPATSVTSIDGAITLHGAREHNLKNLSVAIPRGKFVVVTGVSGSGKSTLAFDLLFAEGQRRFLDSMNAYARQFVEQLSRPDVDLITGIPPTVSIEQRNSRGGGKSTVATVTEIYHFLRLLFARLGRQYCPDCRLPVEAQTRDELGRRLRAEMKKRGDLLLLAPVVKNRKGFHSDVAEWASKHGYAEVRADKKIYSTSEPFKLDRFREHDVEIVVGVLESKRTAAVHGRSGSIRARGPNKSASAPGAAAPADRRTRAPQHMIDEALELGHGTLFALDNYGQLTVHSTERSCPKCGRSFEPLDPKNFSYNSSQGWCPKCRGFGELFYLPEDVDRGARADAIEESWWSWQEGKRETCPECEGMRLNPIARAVRLVAGRSGMSPFQTSRPTKRSKDGKMTSLPTSPDIDTFAGASVERAFELFRRLKFKGHAAAIARDILPEIRERLKFLNEVGLGYLQLGRGVPTLSGGEAQRIRLAAQLGSNLSGVLYILDEPTIGLHARDNEMLLATLEILKSRGNSLVVVEHDEETMRRADFILDLGPGAGVRGGEVVAAGTLDELLRHDDSITGQCLRAQEAKKYPSRGRRRPVAVAADVRRLTSKPKARNPKSEIDQSLLTSAATKNGWLTLHNAGANNLKDLTVRFPPSRLVVVTGVSGSGKSTLIRECLLPALETALKRKSHQASRITHHGPRVTGHESLKAVYEVDQSPIGRTPRSTPATYVGFFDEIRNLFAQLPEARLRGYTSGRFSFNSAQGRCPECEGAGTIKLEMNFLPPAFVRCETCQGMRFSPETLDIEFNGKNVAQVLELSVAEAIEFFSAFQKIRRPLEALRDTGLDYLHLGQTSPTLSGGEAQRVKIVTHLLTGLKEQLELFDPKQKRNLFILEEPTIGLHMADVRRLVEVLQRLVDAGHSVIVIEHNLDLIAEADWVIDLGPEGGDGGGQIVAEGTPEEVARTKNSHTGRFLRSVLAGGTASRRP